MLELLSLDLGNDLSKQTDSVKNRANDDRWGLERLIEIVAGASNGPNREDCIERIEECVEDGDENGVFGGHFLLRNRCRPERMF